MIKNRIVPIVAIAVLSATLTGCDEPSSSMPKTSFNQSLTDAARRESSLPQDVERIECWAQKRPVVHDRVFCNISLRGQAVKDLNTASFGWNIPVYLPGRLSSDDRYLSPHSFDLNLLVRAGFFLVANNSVGGLTVEVAADQSQLSLSGAQDFVVALLPELSKELRVLLANAHAASPASIRATWAASQPSAK